MIVLDCFGNHSLPAVDQEEETVLYVCVCVINHITKAKFGVNQEVQLTTSLIAT